jgi:hypothetical protein
MHKLASIINRINYRSLTGHTPGFKVHPPKHLRLHVFWTSIHGGLFRRKCLEQRYGYNDEMVDILEEWDKKDWFVSIMVTLYVHIRLKFVNV